MANHPNNAELELANTPNAHQLERRGPSPPRWFGPHAILEAVERLIISDDNPNADAGCTLEQIKGYLMQRHTQRLPLWQQEIEEELPLNLFDDDMLRVQLARLLQMGHLKVVVGVGGGGEERYTLSPPYLPPWFGPDAVLRAVGKLDKVNAGGSTWDRIMDSLKPSYHYQPQKPLPPEFGTVLRTMLSVLHQKGHLTTITRGSANGGPRHYTRQQAPALVERNTIEIPDYLWFYYLGYKLGAGGGLSMDDSDGGGRYNLSMAPSSFPFPSWFRPEEVLQAVGVLDGRNNNDNGWTSAGIRGYFASEHRHYSHPGWFDKLVRTMLSVLRQRGHLRRGASGPRHYTRRGAPVTTTGIPGYLLCYYAGYKLGGGYALDDDVEVEMESVQAPNDGLQRRWTTSATAETEVGSMYRIPRPS